MSELCRWEYARHAYCVVYHGNDGDKCYYSPGTMEHADIEEVIQSEEAELVAFSGLVQDDDSVQMLIYRVQKMVGLSAEYLYFYIESADGSTAVNMAFDYTYKLNAKQVRKLAYNPLPNPLAEFEDDINDEFDWANKIGKHDFVASLLSTFTYPSEESSSASWKPVRR